jgi:hypothetical protein
MAETPFQRQTVFMRQNNPSHEQIKKPAATTLPAAKAPLNKNGIAARHSAEELARKAYFSYLDEGSQHGHAERHWLAAEKDLMAERNRGGLEPLSDSSMEKSSEMWG